MLKASKKGYISNIILKIKKNDEEKQEFSSLKKNYINSYNEFN